jgi:hypothetical protein
MFDRLQTEAKQIVIGLIEQVYFMRGAISYEEMMCRSYGERQLISEFLEKRLKSEKTNPYPVY